MQANTEETHTERFYYFLRCISQLNYFQENKVRRAHLFFIAQRQLHVMCAQPLSRVWLCNPANCSPQCFSAPGIFLARILEWVAISSFRDWTCLSCGSCIGRQFLFHWATWETHSYSGAVYMKDRKIGCSAIFLIHSSKSRFLEKSLDNQILFPKNQTFM